MKNRANYLICLMEILFQLKKIRYLLKINEGDIYKPDMKNKDFFDIFKTICYNIDYIEKIINKSYYKYEIKIICFKYEYTETHLFISNKIDEYKQDHINNQYTLIKKALTKIIELTDIYNNFYKDDIIIEENGVRQTLEYSWTHEPTSDIYTLVYRNPDTEHYIEGTIVYTYEYYFSNMKGSLSIGHDDGIDSKYSCEVIN